MNYVQKLRAFANYLEDKPELVERLGYWDYPSESIWAKDWEDFQELVKHLRGYEKSGYSGTLSAQHSVKDQDTETGRVFIMTIHVGDVCEKVAKVDEDGEPVMQAKSKYVETDELVPVYEYKCPTVWSD